MSLALHPTEKQLQNLVGGTIDEGEIEQIASHLEECPPCEETLVRLESEEQTLVSRLTHIATE